MINQIFLELPFWIALGSACIYLIAYGGRTEVIGALLIMGAAAVTEAAPMSIDFDRAILLVKSVDISLFVAMLILALNSNKFWPLWFCGFHLLTVASHFSLEMGLPESIEFIFNFSQFWSIPAIGSAVLGTYLDRHSEVKPLM